MLILADPLLTLMYGRTFDDQLAILALLGAYAALGHVAAIMRAGLRALEFMRPAFFSQLAVSALALAVAVPIAEQFGVVGALTGVLIARAALATIWTLLFKNKAAALSRASP
jgi:O-antigen/teichoic acid export membrane protein